MEKKSIEIKKTAKPIVVEFQGQEITVLPYLTLETKKTLMMYYLSTMNDYNPIEDNFLVAENSLILGIIDHQTDIEIDNIFHRVENENVKVSIDEIISSGLWDLVKANLVNLAEFKIEIDKVVKLAREDIAIQKSVGMTFDKLSNGIMNFLSKISEVDLSKEGVSKILEALDQQKDEYNKIVDPSKVKESKPRKKKEILQ